MKLFGRCGQTARIDNFSGAPSRRHPRGNDQIDAMAGPVKGACQRGSEPSRANDRRPQSFGVFAGETSRPRLLT